MSDYTKYRVCRVLCWGLILASVYSDVEFVISRKTSWLTLTTLELVLAVLLFLASVWVRETSPDYKPEKRKKDV